MDTAYTVKTIGLVIAWVIGIVAAVVTISIGLSQIGIDLMTTITYIAILISIIAIIVLIIQLLADFIDKKVYEILIKEKIIDKGGKKK